MSRTYKNLSFEENGAVAKVTLTRPDILNAMDDVTHDEFVDVIERMRRPGDIRCLVMASTGTAFLRRRRRRGGSSADRGPRPPRFPPGIWRAG